MQNRIWASDGIGGTARAHAPSQALIVGLLDEPDDFKARTRVRATAVRTKVRPTRNLEQRRFGITVDRASATVQRAEGLRWASIA